MNAALRGGPPRDWTWTRYRIKRNLALALVLVPGLAFAGAGLVCAALGVRPGYPELLPWFAGVLACMSLGRAWQRSLSERRLTLPAPTTWEARR